MRTFSIAIFVSFFFLSALFGQNAPKLENQILNDKPPASIKSILSDTEIEKIIKKGVEEVAKDISDYRKENKDRLFSATLITYLQKGLNNRDLNAFLDKIPVPLNDMEIEWFRNFISDGSEFNPKNNLTMEIFGYGLRSFHGDKDAITLEIVLLNEEERKIYSEALAKHVGNGDTIAQNLSPKLEERIFTNNKERKIVLGVLGQGNISIRTIDKPKK